MKTFIIYETNPGIEPQRITTIQAVDGKSALEEFSKTLSVWLCDIHQLKHIWELSTSYGRYFYAIEAKEA